MKFSLKCVFKVVISLTVKLVISKYCSLLCLSTLSSIKYFNSLYYYNAQNTKYSPKTNQSPAKLMTHLKLADERPHETPLQEIEPNRANRVTNSKFE